MWAASASAPAASETASYARPEVSLAARHAGRPPTAAVRTPHL